MLTFGTLYGTARQTAGTGKLPRVRVMNARDYLDRQAAGQSLSFPPTLCEAQVIAYRGRQVATYTDNGRGELLVLLGSSAELTEGVSAS